MCMWGGGEGGHVRTCTYMLHTVALCCLVSRTDRFMYAKLEFSLLIRW